MRVLRKEMKRSPKSSKYQGFDSLKHSWGGDGGDDPGDSDAFPFGAYPPWSDDEEPKPAKKIKVSHLGEEVDINDKAAWGERGFWGTYNDQAADPAGVDKPRSSLGWTPPPAETSRKLAQLATDPSAVKDPKIKGPVTKKAKKKKKEIEVEKEIEGEKEPPAKKTASEKAADRRRERNKAAACRAGPELGFKPGESSPEPLDKPKLQYGNAEQIAKFQHLLGVYLKSAKLSPSSPMSGIRVVYKVEDGKELHQVRGQKSLILGQTTFGNFGGSAADVAGAMAGLACEGWQKDHIKSAKAWLLSHPQLQSKWGQA